MKALYCVDCEDLITLNTKAKTCACGKIGGAHVNQESVTYHGPAILLEVNKNELLSAAKLSQLSHKKTITKLNILHKSDKFIQLGK